MRNSKYKRKTKETEIDLNLLIEGTGEARIETGIPFLSHLLNLLAYNSLFDLEITAKGDLSHHITEDIGIALGSGMAEALADKKGIRRYGNILLPMDETLVMVAVDISGRPSLVIRGNTAHLPFMPEGLTETEMKIYSVSNTNDFFGEMRRAFQPITISGKVDEFDIGLVEEFLKALVNKGGLTLHINLLYGKDIHHIVEAVFKGIGRALRQACELDERITEVPSTKGIL